eukprot:g18636.t1
MFSVGSITPMIGITVGDNIAVAFPNVQYAREISRITVILPPAIMAAAFKRLDVIFTISGLLGMIASFVYPAYLQIESVKCFKAKGLEWRTEFSNTSSHVPQTVFLITMLLLALAIWTILF